MDAELLAAITGLAGAAKTSIEAVRAALGTKGRGAEKALAPIADLQARVFELQEIALRLQRELAQAQEENAKLRAQIRQHEERAADRERYELRYLNGSPVMVDKEHPEAPLCAMCFEADAKVYLTKLPSDDSDVGTHYCPKCQGIVGAP
jgi:chromosome segregation ATPase